MAVDTNPLPTHSTDVDATRVEPTRSTLEPVRDRRLVLYVAFAAVGLAITLATGDNFIGALTAMYIAVTVYGLRLARPTVVTATPTDFATRIIEGDEATITVRITHDQRLDVVARVEVPLHVAEQPTIFNESQTADGLQFSIRRNFPHFGNQRVGRIVATATAPGSLVSWRGVILDLGDLRVLPHADRLDELLAPRASQVSAGAHASTSQVGDGVEFSEVREYLPGDRLRDINWKVTARRGMPFVTRRVPERGGTVVIVIDGLRSDVLRRDDIEFQLVERAGRAAWALIRNHMASQDRVGLVIRSSQRQIVLPPRGGSRAQYALMDALLELTSDRSNQVSVPFDPRSIPPGSLAFALTPLLRFDSSLPVAALAANGRSVGVLALSSDDLIADDDPDAEARRLLSMVFDAQMAFLRRANIPAVVWKPTQDIDRAVRRLSEMAKRRNRR